MKLVKDIIYNQGFLISYISKGNDNNFFNIIPEIISNVIILETMVSHMKRELKEKHEKHIKTHIYKSNEKS